MNTLIHSYRGLSIDGVSGLMTDESKYRYLDSAQISLSNGNQGFRVLIDGTQHSVDRIARLFPRTNPDHYISFLNPSGHEIGVLGDPGKLDDASLTLLQAELKAIYFVPNILEILSVERRGTGSYWEVSTNDGDVTFTLQSTDALDGSAPPSITIRDGNGKRYKIDDYWELDKDSRNEIVDMLPRNLLRVRHGKGRGSSSRGSSMSGGMMR